MATAAARGLVIPDDLSIIGYNDIPVVSRLPVPLTTIREPFNHIARGAIDLLFDETPSTPVKSAPSWPHRLSSRANPPRRLHGEALNVQRPGEGRRQGSDATTVQFDVRLPRCHGSARVVAPVSTSCSRMR